ncbi:MAG: response regulator [Gemmatimonadetes bacterium]|nr:response regulator [Gemmatimonadota bacterium]
MHAGKLDGLLAATGELLVERGRIAHATDEIVALAEDVAAFAVRWHATGRVLRLAAERGQVGPRVQVAIRDLDVDVQRLFRRTGQLAGAASRDARSVAGVVDRVAERSHGLRMRPFGETAEPLARTVRDLAKASGKEVRLEIVGAEVEADRAVLDGLRDALLQLVRNAVDHGIESPAERERRDKPRAGTVRVAAALAGDRILVDVRDDGAGLDAGRIRTVLAARGLPAPADDAALGDALLSGGISTRTEADAISGRGVGLDIVRNAVQRIQGGIRVTWEAGAGSTFTIECRPSLATTRAVLVGVGGALLAIPTTHIARVLRVRLADIRQVQGRPVITTDQGPVPLVSLARLLGPPLTDRPVGDVVPAALLEYGQQRIAVAVDELVAEAEVVVRPIQQDGMPARYVSGATVLGSGRVAPVLNAAAVVAAGLGVTTGGLELAEREVQPRRHRILVVDDSITTRTLEESVLEAAGYEVLTAVDGADAWRVLQEQGCDLVVADVDMPRMDGFDLCRSIRTSKRFKELPVVLVTALEAPEHRRRGMEVGADAYIGKSGFDQEQLLKTIRQFLD